MTAQKISKFWCEFSQEKKPYHENDKMKIQIVVLVLIQVWGSNSKS